MVGIKIALWILVQILGVVGVGVTFYFYDLCEESHHIPQLLKSGLFCVWLFSALVTASTHFTELMILYCSGDHCSKEHKTRKLDVVHFIHTCISCIVPMVASLVIELRFPSNLLTCDPTMIDPDSDTIIHVLVVNCLIHLVPLCYHTYRSLKVYNCCCTVIHSIGVVFGVLIVLYSLICL